MKGRKSKSWVMAYCGMAAALFSLSKKSLRAFFAKLLSELQNKFL